MPPTETTIESLLNGLWARIIDAVSLYGDVPAQAVSDAISSSRKFMTAYNWPLDVQNRFFRELRDGLKAGTRGLPAIAMIIRLLEVETEFDA